MAKKKSTHARDRSRARDPTALHGCRAAVIGLNGTGRRIALLLASSGIRALLLVDDRIVGDRVQRVAGFDYEDTGRLRAHATAQACHEVNPSMDIVTHAARSQPDLTDVDVVFRCRRVSDGSEVTSLDTIVTIEAAANRSDRATIGMCREPNAGRDEPVPSPQLPPAVEAIISGLAVQGFAALLSGQRHRYTRRFTVGDADFFITLD